MRWQNSDVSRYFARRAELGSALGEVEKRQDGVFQRTISHASPRVMIPLYDHNPTHRTPYVTILLIAINTAVMVWLTTLSPIEQQVAAVEHGFIPARIAQLGNPRNLEVPIHEVVAVRDGLGRQQPALRVVDKINLPPSRMQIFGSVLTTMFMHGGWMHLVGNMWFLWIFGNNVEDRLGHVLYAVFYLVGGLLATASHWAYDPASLTPVIGASGAASTILGAYAVTWPKATVTTLIFFGFITTVEIPALVWLGIWFGGQLLDAFANRDLGVAVWAHIGGFVAGAILMPILSFGAPPPGSTWSEEVKKHFLPSGHDEF
jgi:membrane associated rhomboid family serine protease